MTAGRRLRVQEKALLACLIWLEYGRVLSMFRRRPLPEVVRRLARVSHRPGLPSLSPESLGRVVHRTLNVGPFRPRCLTMSLVLFRLLARAGVRSALVVGLPAEPVSHEAHAWVEVGGDEVGPPPGRLGHEEMARYGEDVAG